MYLICLVRVQFSKSFYYVPVLRKPLSDWLWIALVCTLTVVFLGFVILEKFRIINSSNAQRANYRKLLMFEKFFLKTVIIVWFRSKYICLVCIILAKKIMKGIFIISTLWSEMVQMK